MSNQEYSQYYVRYDPNAVAPEEMEERIFIPIKHCLNQMFTQNGLPPLSLGSDRWTTRVILNYYTSEPESVYSAFDVDGKNE